PLPTLQFSNSPLDHFTMTISNNNSTNNVAKTSSLVKTPAQIAAAQAAAVAKAAAKRAAAAAKRLPVWNQLQAMGIDLSPPVNYSTYMNTHRMDWQVEMNKAIWETIELDNRAYVSTPVNLNKGWNRRYSGVDLFGLMAAKHYRDQSNKFETGGAMWDSDPSDHAQIGDYFIFVHNISGYMEIFMIIGKGGDEIRPKDWVIPQHSERSVLILSPMIGVCKTEDWETHRVKPEGNKKKYVVKGTSRSAPGKGWVSKTPVYTSIE
ncbi:unnamed protein product, partial [Ectocarpus sp. 4 AP-2014]